MVHQADVDRAREELKELVDATSIDVVVDLLSGVMLDKAEDILEGWRAPSPLSKQYCAASRLLDDCNGSLAEIGFDERGYK